ncbi:hypothetical protein [Providencia rettgeri]|uniref:hypothetical protein n=1 Tax=Providencia rettgeri TaxID=587 RepID=UPI002551E3EE|nr:hypothetical protein [Providencia rettgeri]MDK7743485.1 hypothetical protein [Providencia rettgeri]MDK7756327.1 hypothetical protein [Providencia rettgeri]
MKFFVFFKRILLVVFIAHLSSCATFKGGDPIDGGVIDYLEAQYPEDSHIRTIVAKGVIELDLAQIRFLALREFCESNGGNFQQSYISLAWCLNKNNEPTFIVHSSRHDYMIAVVERNKGISVNEWIDSAKDIFPAIWKNPNENN